VSRVTFSGPESSVDMEAMRGFNGKTVKVMNLPSATHTFSHKGTNRFTSKWDVGSK
jgi:hypothetical protein